MNTLFQNPSLHDVHKILSDNSLPVDDLNELNFTHFFACGEKTNPKGIIGLEHYGTDGLLRSLAVDADVQGKGCGSDLYARLEQYAKSLGINTLYLLTETAELYFKNRGFESIDRNLASESIKQTKEFSGLCSGSATLMRKLI